MFVYTYTSVYTDIFNYIYTHVCIYSHVFSGFKTSILFLFEL